MLRFKQFSGRERELERAVNDWLEEFEPDVTQMVQTVASDGSVILSLLFEESFRGQELRLSSERGARANSRVRAPAQDTTDIPIRVPQEPGQYVDPKGTS